MWILGLKGLKTNQCHLQCRNAINSFTCSYWSIFPAKRLPDKLQWHLTNQNRGCFKMDPVKQNNVSTVIS